MLEMVLKRATEGTAIYAFYATPLQL